MGSSFTRCEPKTRFSGRSIDVSALLTRDSLLSFCALRQMPICSDCKNIPDAPTPPPFPPSCNPAAPSPPPAPPASSRLVAPRSAGSSEMHHTGASDASSATNETCRIHNNSARERASNGPRSRATLTNALTTARVGDLETECGLLRM